MQDQRAWLELLCQPQALVDLAAEGLSQGQAVQALLQSARRAPGFQRVDASQLDAAEHWLQADQRRGLMLRSDPAWPTAFADLPGMPLGLFWLGDLDCLRVPQLAIVGSRNPTPAGGRHARSFARSLAGAGLGITSGLAMGIDTAAHLGALDAQGVSIAVCGRGLDACYPASNRPLFARLEQEGLLLSEYLPGTSPRRSHFPARNRIIAALGRGTLVVEASPNSGSLITARQALSFGREVFAMPGAIDNPLARGCHQLIRDGAHLAESPRDVLEPLAPGLLNYTLDFATPESSPTSPHSPDDSLTQALLAALDSAPASIDTLVARTGLPVAEISSKLLILELQGTVAIAPGGGYQRIGSSA